MQKTLHLAVAVDNQLSFKAYRAAVLQTEQGTKRYFQTKEFDKRLSLKDYLEPSMTWACMVSGQHRGNLEYSVVSSVALLDRFTHVENFPRVEAQEINPKQNKAFKVILDRLSNPELPAEA